MNKKWLIDTDIIFDLLRGLPNAMEFMESVLTESECFISLLQSQNCMEE